MRKALLLSVLLACPVAAQTSDTTCSQTGQFVNCHTTTFPQQQGTDWAAWARLQQEQQAQQQQVWSNLGATISQRRADRQSQDGGYAAAMADVRQHVIAKMRAGDCKGAADLALLAGDIDLATKAKAYCGNPTP